MPTPRARQFSFPAKPRLASTPMLENEVASGKGLDASVSVARPRSHAGEMRAKAYAQGRGAKLFLFRN